MANILIHVTCGPENPTKAALAFLVARTALSEGHDVNLFLAGDGVQLMLDTVLDSLVGIGTGALREHFDDIAARGGKFYLSGMSSKARGLGADQLDGKPAEMAMPDVLVRLAVDSDTSFTY